MATKTVVTNLDDEILAVLSTMNGREGIVSHNLSEIEAHLKEQKVSYSLTELNEAMMRLVRDRRITMHVWCPEPRREPAPRTNDYEPYFVGIMSVA